MDYQELTQELMELLRAEARMPQPKQLRNFARGEMAVLIHLLEQPAGITAGKLSEGLSISSARVAAMLNTLQQKKYIQRSIDPLDHRRIRVTLTSDGRAAISAATELVTQMFETILHELGTSDASEYIRIFKRMLAIRHDLFAREAAFMS